MCVCVCVCVGIRGVAGCGVSCQAIVSPWKAMSIILTDNHTHFCLTLSLTRTHTHTHARTHTHTVTHTYRSVVMWNEGKLTVLTTRLFWLVCVCVSYNTSISDGDLCSDLCVSVCPCVHCGVCGWHVVDMLTGLLHPLLLPAANWWGWVIFNGFSGDSGSWMCWETEADPIRLWKKFDKSEHFWRAQRKRKGRGYIYPIPTSSSFFTKSCRLSVKQ